MFTVAGAYLWVGQLSLLQMLSLTAGKVIANDLTLCPLFASLVETLSLSVIPGLLLKSALNVRFASPLPSKNALSGTPSHEAPMKHTRLP